MSFGRAITPDSIADAHEAVAEFNRQHAVGTRVQVQLYGGLSRETVTLRPAFVLSQDIPVVDLDRIGCYFLERVIPL